MSRLRTLIVDDEPLAREGVRLLLRRDPEIDVIGEAGRGADAVQAILRERPDLVFLDVQMPEKNGFEVLREVGEENLPIVVFVTAHDRYALEAFEVRALDYLLKPFDDERFYAALARAKQQFEQRQASDLSRKLVDLVRDFEPPALPTGPPNGGHLERLVVKSSGRVVFLRTDEIDWIEAADYYVKLHAGGRSHLLRETMSHLEQRLDPGRFLRIHRSTIVNLERIEELRPQANGEGVVCLRDGTRLRFSRSRRDRLAALLER